ncbi:hypothetical protein PR048_026970 [Dryococelus australis]|uniref:Uncharacterized protein n=1 Tax=Dryococelus australis TaxID=614101 RepID=A0ABQ9GMS3_9NEOP|nr:hypothetical protein PR048_026970 [Dryococelus australis]
MLRSSAIRDCMSINICFGPGRSFPQAPFLQDISLTGLPLGMCINCSTPCADNTIKIIKLVVYTFTLLTPFRKKSSQPSAVGKGPRRHAGRRCMCSLGGEADANDTNFSGAHQKMASVVSSMSELHSPIKAFTFAHPAVSATLVRSRAAIDPGLYTLPPGRCYHSSRAGLGWADLSRSRCPAFAYLLPTLAVGDHSNMVNGNNNLYARVIPRATHSQSANRQPRHKNRYAISLSYTRVFLGCGRTGSFGGGRVAALRSALPSATRAETGLAGFAESVSCRRWRGTQVGPARCAAVFSSAWCRSSLPSSTSRQCPVSDSAQETRSKRSVDQKFKAPADLLAKVPFNVGVSGIGNLVVGIHALLFITLTVKTTWYQLLTSTRLPRSPPTKANRVQSPTGSPDFRKWESYRMMPLIGGSSRGSPVSPRPFIPTLLRIHFNHPHQLSKCRSRVSETKRSHHMLSRHRGDVVWPFLRCLRADSLIGCARLLEITLHLTGCCVPHWLASKLLDADCKPYSMGAAVPQRLDCPRQAEHGSILGLFTPDFRKWGSCRTMTLVGGFPRGGSASPSPPPVFRRCSVLPSLHPHRLSRPPCCKSPKSLHLLTYVVSGHAKYFPTCYLDVVTSSLLLRSHLGRCGYCHDVEGFLLVLPFFSSFNPPQFHPWPTHASGWPEPRICLCHASLRSVNRTVRFQNSVKPRHRAVDGKPVVHSMAVVSPGIQDMRLVQFDCNLKYGVLLRYAMHVMCAMSILDGALQMLNTCIRKVDNTRGRWKAHLSPPKVTQGFSCHPLCRKLGYAARSLWVASILASGQGQYFKEEVQCHGKECGRRPPELGTGHITPRWSKEQLLGRSDETMETMRRYMINSPISEQGLLSPVSRDTGEGSCLFSCVRMLRWWPFWVIIIPRH